MKTRPAPQPATGAALIAIVLGATLGVFSTLRVYSNDALVTRSYAVKSALAAVLASITSQLEEAQAFD